MKTVYVVMNAEFFHPGHLNIIQVARELGEVTVGVATDELCASYKRLPILNYEHRKAIVENIKGVKRVIPQESLNLEPVLRELKPDFFVHGDDWKTGRNIHIRQQVIELMEEWGGLLVEPPYTEGISSTLLNVALKSNRPTMEQRAERFRRVLTYQPVVRVLEVYDSLTGLIAEQTQININGKPKEFDAMWYGMLAASLSNKNDPMRSIEIIHHMRIIQNILDVTTKPLIVDMGNGGALEQFIGTLKTLENLGVSSIIVEDSMDSQKMTGLVEKSQSPQETVDELVNKVEASNKDRLNKEFSTLTRISSLTCHRGSKDALLRAQAYQKAGANGLMIQFNPNNLTEFFDFCSEYQSCEVKLPLGAALPEELSVREGQWIEAGVQIILYSATPLRTACKNLFASAEMLLR